MARLRKPQRSNPLSSFYSAYPSAGAGPASENAGNAFDLLAQAAEAAYSVLDPYARRKAEEEGLEAGRAAAEGTETSITVPGGAEDTAVDASFSRGRGRGDYAAEFDARLAMSESGGRYGIVNSEGYTGKYQFGQERLNDYNRARGTSYTTADLKANPSLQEEVQDWHVQDIDAFIDGNGLNQYIGQTVGGVPITRDGLRAMAHLGGKGGMQRFIETGGAYNPSDSNGTRLSDYAVRFSTSQSRSGDPVVTVRTESGQLEGRANGIFSSEYDLIHDAAASQAYLSNMLVRAQADLMDLSAQFPLDPDSFRSASQTYIERVIEKAPDFAQQDLMMALSEERNRRWLGMREEKQADIRRRANNSSRALVEQYSAQYAELLAAGDEEGATAMRSRLESTLRARETLPGVAWTPAQTENALRKAEAEAERLRVRAREEWEASASDTLGEIADMAKDGMTHAEEGIMADERVQGLPEYREARVWTMLRDTGLPSFRRLPPDQMGAVIDEERQSVADDVEADVIGALEETRAEAIKALENDPMGYAGKVGGLILEPGGEAVAPPPLPDFSTTNERAFQNALTRRLDYARRMQSAGFTDELVLLSEEEADSMSEMFKGEIPAEAKAGMAGVMVAGWGRDASAAFDQMEVDTVTRYAGRLMAAGNSTTAIDALRGQEKIDANVVRVPSNARRISAVSQDIADALAELPNGTRLEADMMALATALYANEAHAKGIEPDSEDAIALYEGALQKALGQSRNARGVLMGGVQEVSFGGGTHSALLPPDVTAAAAGQALNRALGADFRSMSAMEQFAASSLFSNEPVAAFRADAWQAAAASGEAPMFGAESLEDALGGNLAPQDLRIVAIGRNLYRLEAVIGGQPYDLTAPDGSAYLFDLNKLIEATR